MADQRQQEEPSVLGLAAHSPSVSGTTYPVLTLLHLDLAVLRRLFCSSVSIFLCTQMLLAESSVWFLTLHLRFDLLLLKAR